MLIVLKINAYREEYQRLPKATYIVATHPFDNIYGKLLWAAVPNLFIIVNPSNENLHTPWWVNKGFMTFSLNILVYNLN